MKRQKTLLSPGGWTALLLLLALGLWEADVYKRQSLLYSAVSCFG